MKNIIKINYSDTGNNRLNPENNYFTNILRQRFQIEISDKPDFLIHSVYGKRYLKYDCFRICYSGENIRPDFALSDFHIGSDILNDQRYLRWPHYLLYSSPVLIVKNDIPEEIFKTKTKFCCFIVSNPRASKRIEFFNKLSDYRKVDSAGKVLNNVGYNLPYENNGKISFIKDYKFVMAFENESYPGYSTEKIYEPMLVRSIPIYWGDPMVSNDFNPGSFINVDNFKTFDEAIEYIKEVDMDDKLYMQILSEPYFYGNKVPDNLKTEKFLDFFEYVFSAKGKIKPVAKKYQKYIYYWSSTMNNLRIILSRIKRKTYKLFGK